MTQIWPGFGVAPVPTVLSIICKPEAVVMVFPSVWAAAMVGTHANGTATSVIAIAASIGIFPRWRRRIFGHLPLRNETCLAHRDLRFHPIRPRKYAGLETPTRRIQQAKPKGDQAALDTRACPAVTSLVMTENFASCTAPKLVEIATSAAPPPRAITIRPIRGWL